MIESATTCLARKMEERNESHLHSVLKAVSWRILATTVTVLIVFAFTGKFVLSAGVGAVEVIMKLILYYSHERIWIVIRKRRVCSRGQVRARD